MRPIKRAYLRVNDAIHAKEVRLVGSDGEQVGIVSIEEARRHAEEADLDLVEVAPDANPPVCKIVDYRKQLYDQRRREREARKRRRHTEIKEVKMRPTIDRHDLDVKVRRIQKFLDAGHKVKVTVMFRGREMAYSERGRDLLLKVTEELADHGAMEDRLVQVGRQQHMILAPVPQPKKKVGKDTTTPPPALTPPETSPPQDSPP